MKKILTSLLLTAALAVSMFAVTAQAAEGGKAYGKVPATDTKITVDGKKDAIYDKGLKVAINVTTDSCPSTAEAYLLWNGKDTIYIYAPIKDATPQKITPANAWTCDSLEVFLDYSNKVARTRDQYRIDIMNTATYYDTKTYTNAETKAFGFENWAVTDIDGGYALEFEIKAYKEAVSANMNVGFHLMLNDLLADGKTRKMAHSDACGNDPKKFGYITLSGDKVVIEAPKASASTFDPAILAVVSLASAAGAAFVSKKRK